MKVTSEHHTVAKDLFNQGKNSPQVQQHLMKVGLTKSQANDCKNTARKQLGIYKKQSNIAKQKARQASSDADAQAEMKTEITLD